MCCSFMDFEVGNSKCVAVAAVLLRRPVSCDCYLLEQVFFISASNLRLMRRYFLLKLSAVFVLWIANLEI